MEIDGALFAPCVFLAILSIETRGLAIDGQNSR